MTVSSPARSLAIGGAMTVVGAALTIVGTLLPWAHFDPVLAAAANASSSPIGFEWDDGKIFVFVAVLTIVASGCRLAGQWLSPRLVAPVDKLLGSGAGLSALAGGYVVCFGILNLRDITAEADRRNAMVGGAASVGIGIYLDLAAGIVILAGGAIGLLLKRR
jgi:hypothetical protein